MTITCQPATVHTHTRHKAISWAPRKKRVQRPRCSTATGQRGSGVPPPPGGTWSPGSAQGHSPGSSTHSPSHSHKIPCLPSMCASAPPRVSWGTCGAGPLLGFLPAPEIKAWKGEGTPFPGFQPDTCSGLGPTWSFPSSATLCPPLPHPDYSDPPGHPGSFLHAESERVCLGMCQAPYIHWCRDTCPATNPTPNQQGQLHHPNVAPLSLGAPLAASPCLALPAAALHTVHAHGLGVCRISPGIGSQAPFLTFVSLPSPSQPGSTAQPGVLGPDDSPAPHSPSASWSPRPRERGSCSVFYGASGA